MDSGRSVAETARQYSVAEATLYQWREKFGG
ncbi:MAG: transposase [Armatimonadota bacterium]